VGSARISPMGSGHPVGIGPFLRNMSFKEIKYK
jgi:hypothetical protein